MLSNIPKTSSHWIRDILGLTLLFLIFYLFWIGSYPFFIPDEGRYSEVAREMVATGDYITPRLNGVAFLDKPILYYWLQAIAVRLFGVKEWALRLFPAMLGVLGCIVTYICGRRLFSRRVGFLSAIILATTPLYFGGSHYANLDLEVAVFISCTLLFFMTGIQSEDKSRPYFFFAAYLSAALAFLTKGLIGIVFPMVILGSWMILLNRLALMKKLHLVCGVILFSIVVLPWYWLVQKANPAFLHYFFVTQQVTRFLSEGVFNNPTPFWFYVPIVLIGFFPWTSFFIQALGISIRNVIKDRYQHQIELFLLLWFSFVFVFFSIPQSKTITYILPVFPAAALLVGHVLSTFWETPKTKTIYWGVVILSLIGLLLAILFLALPHYQWLEISTNLTPYLTTIAILFLISLSLAFFSLRQTTLRLLFTTCASISSLSLFILAMSTIYLNHDTAKPLIEELKLVMQPQEEVANYFKFYQDVPLYLGKRITLVANWDALNIAKRDNWVRELWYGIPFQKTDDWLISEKTFFERWHNKKRMYAFVNENFFDQFKLYAKKYYFLGRYNDIILLSNQPTYLTTLWEKNSISVVTVKTN